MNRHTATHPEGPAAKRNSLNRTYTHAVWVRDNEQERATCRATYASRPDLLAWYEKQRATWTVASWAGSAELARKAAARYDRSRFEVMITEATLLK